MHNKCDVCVCVCVRKLSDASERIAFSRRWKRRKEHSSPLRTRQRRFTSKHSGKNLITIRYKSKATTKREFKCSRAREKHFFPFRRRYHRRFSGRQENGIIHSADWKKARRWKLREMATFTLDQTNCFPFDRITCATQPQGPELGRFN